MMTNSAFQYCDGCDGYNCDEDKGCSYPDPRPVAAPQQPARGADAFRNMLAILHNLETSDLSFLTAEQCESFYNDMSWTILRLDDARLDALYALVQSKQPAKYRGAI